MENTKKIKELESKIKILKAQKVNLDLELKNEKDKNGSLESKVINYHITLSSQLTALQSENRKKDGDINDMNKKIEELRLSLEAQRQKFSNALDNSKVNLK